MSEAHPAPACITCGDVAVPMRVVAAAGEDGLADCVSREGDAVAVDVTLVDEVAAGDALLVHACVAIQLLEAGAA